MTTPGDPHPLRRRGHKSRLLQFNSNYGYIFTIVSYLIGVFIFATIVGQVGNVITNRNANRLEFERLLDGAKTYMRHHKVPGGMKRRVLRWYDYSWSRGRIQGGGDINTALGLLPDKLKTELALHVNLSVLKKVTIFQECQPEFLHDLVLKMKAYIFTPGDLICRKGEVAREMFIIADGILDVISETGRVLTTMKAGDFFGEIGILNLDGLNKRTADVRSVGYSELFSLSREDVLTAMKDYPEAQEILQSLGRKRLMEARNASKLHKAQAKQVKDHDSSGDSDTAGKRIVEKLRSDVKGLKNALRRSRRGTRTKDSMEGGNDNAVSKSQDKKHCILRRMSHVQSSEEYEVSEVAQSPIGAGLPLLQRLKLLKEKQEKERDEREKAKSNLPGGVPAKKEENQEPEVIGAGLPLTQRLKLLKQKEEREAFISGSTNTSSTVRTQVSGVRFDRAFTKSKTIASASPGDLEVGNIQEASKPKEDSETEVPPTARRKESAGLLKEKLKLLQTSQAKEKTAPSKNAQDSDPVLLSSKVTSPENTDPETSINVPVTTETANIVPKPLGSKSEVPKSKESWLILKKSSIRGFKPEKKLRTEDEKAIKVSSKGTYLSKSDTILEKQKSEEKTREKRSRSISPSDDPKSYKRTLKGTVENLIRDRRRTRSLSQASRKLYDEIVDVNAWEFPETALKHFEKTSESSKTMPAEPCLMKKYDSIDDLSPEYSGLPFVKKLKILNERQKLAELEKELVVRSASLDVPERSSGDDDVMLIRSQSEASAIEFRRASGRKSRTPFDVSWGRGSAWNSSGESPKSCESKAESASASVESFKRTDTVIENPHHQRPGSDGSLPSPESNETIERRHLKSILKKLSAEESTSDEDQSSKSIKRCLSLKKSGHADLKKLMRAPTVEGYAARHTKLTKSVTFNRETLQSPPDSVTLETNVEETITKGLSPTSPTAILTLQLSNLSMIPIASPKMLEKSKEAGKLCEPNPLTEEKIKMETIIPTVIEKLQEEVQRFNKSEREMELDNPLLPYIVQEIGDRKNFKMLPYGKGQDEEYFEEVMGMKQVLQKHLEDVQTKFQSQFHSLEMEVKKRDEIIFQLQSKIIELEKQPNKSRPEKSEDANTDSGGTDPELSDVPFLRGDSFETILGVNSPPGELSSVSASPPGAISTRSIGCSPIPMNEDSSLSQDQFSPTQLDSNVYDVEYEDSDTPFDYVGNVALPEEKEDEISENDDNEDDLFDIREKIRLLSNATTKDRSIKRRFRKPWDPQSDEELELLELPKPSKSEESKTAKNYGTELKLQRKFSIDAAGLYSNNVPRLRREMSLDCEMDESRDKFDEKRNIRFDPRMKGNIIDRMSEFRRSFNRFNDNKDFVALDIEDSSSSSEIEYPHNKDWEIQMLADELSKKEKVMKQDFDEDEDEDDEDEDDDEEEGEWEAEVRPSLERAEEMKKLEEEVSKLKQVVCESDLTQLTTSEFDMLETIIEAKDQKIAQLVKTSSFESRRETLEPNRRKQSDSFLLDQCKPENEPKRRSSLKKKIGQAFSFDFHDIDSRRRKSSHEGGKRKSFSLRKQKTISGPYQERQSLDNLLHTSSLLRNRVLEDSSHHSRTKSNFSSKLNNSRSSLPILVSSNSLTLGKNVDLRTSLPSLSAKEYQLKVKTKSNAAECLTSSKSSSDDTFQESDFRESCDSVFEENSGYKDSSYLENETLLEVRNINYPTSSKSLKTIDTHSNNNSLNNFIKTMGQRVKQAVVGEVTTVKDQVPTISKLCDEQSILQQTDLTCSEEILIRDPRESSDEPVRSSDDDTIRLDSLDSNSRTDPPDL